MARIGFAPSVANVKASTIYSNNTIGNKFIITGDGFLMVKDKMFRIPLTTDDNKENIYNLTVSNTEGSLQIGIGGYTHPSVSVLINAASGNMLSASVDKGIVKFDHNKSSKDFTGSTVGPSADASTSIVIPNITYDDYGHITASTTKTATLNQVNQTALTASDTDTFYLLAGKGSQGIAYYNSNITIDASGNLHATKLYVGNTSVEELIHASSAMYYVGSLSNPSNYLPTDPENGDTYIISVAGNYKTGPDDNGIDCEIGDYLIASVVTNTIGGSTTKTVSWACIQGNVKGAVTTSGDSTNLIKYGIAYASDNSKVITSTSAGSQGQYLSTTSEGVPTWANFTGLTFKVGTTTSVYNPYKSGSAIDTITFSGSGGATVTMDGSTINVSTKNDNTTYDMFVGLTNSTANASSTNGNTYLQLKGSDSTLDKVKIYGSGATTVISEAPGEGETYGIINISSTDHLYSFNYLKFEISSSSNYDFLSGQGGETSAADKVITASGHTTFKLDETNNNKLVISSDWRTIKANVVSTGATSTADSVLTSTSLDTFTNKDLVFGGDFMFNSSNEIELAWAEIDENGKVTYSA